MVEETLCPECGGPMVSRKRKSDGQRFWGCATYPACTGTRNTDGEAPSDRDQYPSERQHAGDRDRWRR